MGFILTFIIALIVQQLWFWIVKKIRGPKGVSATRSPKEKS